MKCTKKCKTGACAALDRTCCVPAAQVGHHHEDDIYIEDLTIDPTFIREILTPKRPDKDKK